MNKQLFRSKQNKMVAGVCGGLGEFFSIDPTIIRIIWAAITLTAFPVGVMVYVVATIVVPEDSSNEGTVTEDNDGANASEGENTNTGIRQNFPKYDNKKTRIALGLTLIGIGILFFVKEFFYFDMKYMWPLMLIGIGVIIIYRGGSK